VSNIFDQKNIKFEIDFQTNTKILYQPFNTKQPYTCEGKAAFP